MTDQFLAEIRMFAGNYAPTGWALCNGQLMPISQNTALFSLLGTTYGGDGKTTFALPDLRGAAPMQQGQGPGLSLRSLGQEGGQQAVTLLNSELPSHTHQPVATAASGTTGSPAGARWATTRVGRQGVEAYSIATPDQSMSVAATGPTGGSLPHNNMPPYVVVNYIIALQGIFPPRP
ncbi:phage tail protein [Nocardioides sp.]|jgi:microcystin-dependent protein|uniref:phage tail protein n=1 Tax=Nocardioides sp. TaxID=35761 RepID=UPI002C397190|nr:tail fiber protein [Nocardioides sp.]HVX54682.1 tail fiber protein [Nocardioides sp.]